MTYRADIEAAHAKLTELEHVLQARDAELAELDRAVAERDAALEAALPTERHRVRLRQLEAAIAQARQETAQLRLMAGDAARAASQRANRP
jgi:hypothetical protein